MERSLKQRQELVDDLLNVVEDSVLTLLGDIRNFRLHLTRNESMRDKTTGRMY